MFYLKTHQKEDVFITASLLHKDNALTLNVDLQNLSDTPILLHQNPFTLSPFTLSLSSSFLSIFQVVAGYNQSNSCQAFKFIRLQNGESISKTFVFSLHNEANNSVIYSHSIEVGYTPYGDGAWGEFPYSINAYFPIKKNC